MSVPHSARPHLMKVWAVWHRGHTWGRAMPSHNPYAPMRLATGHRAGDAARPETRQERRGYRAVDATADFNHSAARPALQPPFGHCVPACPCSPAALLVRCATPRVRATPGRSTAITGRGRRSRIRSATWPPLRAEPSGPTAPPTRHGERTRLPPRGRCGPAPAATRQQSTHTGSRAKRTRGLQAAARQCPSHAAHSRASRSAQGRACWRLTGCVRVRSRHPPRQRTARHPVPPARRPERHPTAAGAVLPPWRLSHLLPPTPRARRGCDAAAAAAEQILD